MPHVSVVSSCSWSSNKTIFISFFCFFNFPNSDNKWKKSFAVSVKFFRDFSFIFWYDRMENVNETTFISESFLLNFCKVNNNLSIILKSLSIMNFLKPIKPKLSNNKRSFFGEISRKLHQRVPGLFSLSVLKIANWYLALFVFIIS